MGRTTYDQVLLFGAYPYKDKKSYVFTRNKNPVNGQNIEFASDVDDFIKDVLPGLEGNIWLIDWGRRTNYLDFSQSWRC